MERIEKHEWVVATPPTHILKGGQRIGPFGAKLNTDTVCKNCSGE
jgi:hypothetical protein